jgi:hypothetical protein
MARKVYKRGVYQSYFFRDHDPKLDAIDRVHELAGRPTFKKWSELSSVGAQTFSNWRKRKTKRPQNASMEAALRALGAESVVLYKGQIVRYGNTRPRLTVVGGHGRSKKVA